MRYRNVTGIAASLPIAMTLLIAMTGAGFAHAHLQSATPVVDSIVTQPPRQVTITFTEGVEPLFSTIEVTSAAAHRVDEGKPYLVDGDNKRLGVALTSVPPGLPSGIYTVTWHATSVDTHKTEGTFHFTVAATASRGISVEHVWARATAGAATTGAVYLTVTDNGQADRMIGASTPVAASAQLHETIDDHGVMEMRPLGEVVLDPGKPVNFKPGGYHVMLTGLKAPLHAGDRFPLTLKFEHAAPIAVEVNVEAAGASMIDHDHGSMPGMHDQMGHSP
jgi:copper(I)-binding protein